MSTGHGSESAAEGEPAAHWDDKGLAELQSDLSHSMLRFVAEPLSASTAFLVRGALDPPERRGAGRVVLWDGHRLDASFACDVPLTDDHGSNVPGDELCAALRHFIRLEELPSRVDRAPRDASGIPVLDAQEAIRTFLQAPVFPLADALRAAVVDLLPSPSARAGADQESEGWLRLRGFLLLDASTARRTWTATTCPTSLAWTFVCAMRTAPSPRA
ncbi:hypothetical protein [Streptomyces sp. ODS28]|uniref:hypothetical protein n=1 Tax=Streptomyces sp. ODS28 TaxID=3136688 RepID=UPI0031EA5A57